MILVFSYVATLQEIKEDFFYIYAVEISLMIALMFNSFFSEGLNKAVWWFLVFYIFFLAEYKLYQALSLRKTMKIVALIKKIDLYKRETKASISFLLILLILLSSGGIVNYFIGPDSILREIISTAVEFIPLYIIIYVCWIGYLIYLKKSIIKFLKKYFSSNKKVFSVKGIFVLKKNEKYIFYPLSTALKDYDSLWDRLKHRSEDFVWRNMNVKIMKSKYYKIAVIHTGKMPAKYQSKIVDFLNAINSVNPDNKETVKRMIEKYLI